MSEPSDSSQEGYVPDYRLTEAYETVSRKDDVLTESLCPSYSELLKSEIRYRDDCLIGQGALKSVYRSFDRRTGRWVAMARLRKERGLQYYELFIQEAWLISSLSHPNIIKVHDSGVDEAGRPFFTMDLKGNTSLADVLKSKSSDLRELLGVFIKVCDAVAYAHAQGVIHLDLKPDNIQCNVFGEVLVCDWGLGKRVALDSRNEKMDTLDVNLMEDLTQMGQIQGTLGYMAPEQVVPSSIKDQRTDVYCLGCILYSILTGEAVFKGSTEQILADTKVSKLTGPRIRYPELDIPEGVDAVVVKSLSLDPDERYQSVSNLQHEIHNYLAGYATRAEQPGFFREAALFVARNRLAAAIALIAVVIITVSTVLFAQNIRAHQLKAEEERLRANYLLDEVDTLYSEYTLLKDESRDTKGVVANKLAHAANRLKNYGIFSKPIQTIEQAQALIDVALGLDPKCGKALWELISLHCLSLNYERAVTVPIEFKDIELGFIQFARSFPQFNYSRSKRPSSEVLVNFIWQARKLDQGQAAHLERVITYQHALAPGKAGFNRVILAFIEYVNDMDAGQIKMLYQRNESLHLKSGKGLEFLAHKGGSHQCILRFLPFRSLSLEMGSTFKLSDLHSLEIETLDITKCAIVTLDENLVLPKLRVVHIRSGQISSSTLRRWIASDSNFKIIEH